ncbi:MAG TPA: UDP-N-acetylmuramate dehydrogenase [Blastocatellia bacterium]|nr:UDP-N-acetylmuramate dehydrogenase [Blastocatellia bacterium]
MNSTGRTIRLHNDSGHNQFAQALRENVPLAPLTTLGVGGPARFFADCATGEAMAAGVAWARERGLPVFVLGGGSNVVVADEGFAGLVLRVAIRGITEEVDAGRTVIAAGAGEAWDEFVAYTVERDLAGLECLSGIPGRVGATPIQNVGAYGQETAETLVAVEALDLETGVLVHFDRGECEFGYRASRFKGRDKGRYVITRVSFTLSRGGKPAVRYAELQRYLADAGATTPALAQVRAAVLAIRRRKAMVIDPADMDSRSVGSFFMNPAVTKEDFERVNSIAARLTGSGEAMPAFPAANGLVKLSAAWLIERAGIPRGTVYGNVGTSSKHALAIINRGGGAAREVLELCRLIQSRVRDLFDVELTPEPVFVGFDEDAARGA